MDKMLLSQQSMQSDLRVYRQENLIPESREAPKEILKTSISVNADKKVISEWEKFKNISSCKTCKALIKQSNNTRKSEYYILDKGNSLKKLILL